MSYDSLPSQTCNFPRINEPVPDFDVRTTHGRRKLEQYRGRWLLLFSHPADFTPVCTSEFIAFAGAYQEFQALNCDLLGLSIDSTYSHLAWIRNIEEKFGVAIPFPIIDDVSMRVAHAYGMIMPFASDTATVRSTFLIDPNGILRAFVHYPMTNGRSVRELLRLVTALQVSEKHEVATPEGWQPGDEIVEPPPSTVADAAERMATRDCTDWYFCKRKLSDDA